MTLWRRVVVFLAVVLVSASCSSGGSDESASDSGGRDGNRDGNRTRVGDVDASDVEIPTLPASITVAGESDAQVAELAAKVRADGSDAHAALVTALPLAGFPVADGDQLLSPGFSGDGVAIAPWETWVLAESAGSGRMYLTDVARAVLAGAGADEARADELAGFLRDDLRAAADGPEGTNRFFARFVLALGEPGDLDGEPGTLTLDALAAQLVLRALAGALASGEGESESSGGGDGDGDGTDLGAIRLISAVSDQPCTMTGSERAIVRVSEQLISRALVSFRAGVLRVPWFKGLLPYLETHGMKGAQKLADRIGYAQVLLDYAKFVMALILLRVEGEWDGSGPLVRTHAARPATGERRTFTVHVSYTTGNAQLLNCFRLMFANAGFRFSLPNDGPAEGAGVNFIPVQGFKALHDRIVQFAGKLDVPTDREGKARVGVEGFGQEKAKPKDAPPVAKQLAFDVAVYQRADFGEDLWAALTSSAGVGFLKIPVELLARTRWITTRFVHPVTDWGDENPLFDVTITGKQTTSTLATGSMCVSSKVTGSQSVQFSTAKKRLERLTAEAESGETRVLLAEPGTVVETLNIGVGGGVELARFDATFDVDRAMDVQIGSVSAGCEGVAGGDGDGNEVAPDCGHRRVEKVVSLEYADRLLTLRDDADVTTAEPLYMRCSSGEPELLLVPGGQEVVLDPGSTLDEAALSNPDLDKIIVIGGAREHFQDASAIHTFKRDSQLEWTMVLCRVKADGTSAC